MPPATRYPASENAVIEFYGRDIQVKAVLKNLSATGAFFELFEGDRMPQKGDLIHISVYLASAGKNHEVDAEVIWHKDAGFGVHFLKKDELLDKLIKK